mmetsp:Transcript_5999/g.37207  ORF Transcript_5999/g.37207 Transcript_5999/m.37207 type:complete len:273 (+) Transcript_5999:2128-2946(+)
MQDYFRFVQLSLHFQELVRLRRILVLGQRLLGNVVGVALVLRDGSPSVPELLKELSEHRIDHAERATRGIFSIYKNDSRQSVFIVDVADVLFVLHALPLSRQRSLDHRPRHEAEHLTHALSLEEAEVRHVVCGCQEEGILVLPVPFQHRHGRESHGPLPRARVHVRSSVTTCTVFVAHRRGARPVQKAGSMRFECGFHRTFLNLQSKPSNPTVHDSRCRRACFVSQEDKSTGNRMVALHGAGGGLVRPKGSACEGDVRVLLCYPCTEVLFSC